MAEARVRQESKAVPAPCMWPTREFVVFFLFSFQVFHSEFSLFDIVGLAPYPTSILYSRARACPVSGRLDRRSCEPYRIRKSQLRRRGPVA